MEEFLERVRTSISGRRQRRLGERAVAAQLITSAQLDEALRENGSELGESLVRRGWLSASQLEDLRRSLDDPASAAGFQRYEILDVVGEGAMSVVHRGRDRQLGRAVAVKILRESFFTHPVVRERFAREAQTLAILDHPNVVKVFDAGSDHGHSYLVMELVPGEPLAKVLAARPVDRARLLRILERVARGVQHAHEKGVIHRDLKPENILVTGDDPKVADFGLAHLAASAPALTRSGAVLGTPMYMAPEQIEGGREITARTDVHALGVLLYEILTGLPPHTGGSIPEVYAKIVHDEPVPPRKKDPSIPGELEAIALKALEKEPARRYASAADFAEDLRRYREGEAVTARSFSPARRIGRGIRKQRAVLVVLAILLMFGADRIYRDRRSLAAAEAAGLLETARPPLEKARTALYTNAVDVASMLSSASEAEGVAVRALRLSPDLALGHYRLGEARELRGDYAGAAACFARASELDPKFGPARYRLGRVLLWKAYTASYYQWLGERDARRAEAELMAEQAIGEIEAAQGSGFDNELQREIATAMIAYLRGDKETVHATCREGIRRFDKKEGVEEFHWLLGLVLDPQAALRAFNEALSFRPKFPLALYSRAAVREPEGAIEDYTRAIEISPSFAVAYLHRGSLYWGKGDALNAYADFSRLIQMGELLAGAYNGRGRTLLELMNEPDRALPDLNEAIRLAPEGYPLPYLARARAHLLRKEYAEAIADADKAMKINAWPEMYSIRGRARLGSGDVAGAIPDLEHAMRSSSGMTEAMIRETQAALDRAKQKRSASR